MMQCYVHLEHFIFLPTWACVQIDVAVVMLFLKSVRNVACGDLFQTDYLCVLDLYPLVFRIYLKQFFLSRVKLN